MKEEAIKFLREKGILAEGNTQFIITFSEEWKVDVVDLLVEFMASEKLDNAGNTKELA
jgi:hypothetical protein